MLPYKLIKKKKLQELNEFIASLQSQFSKATAFINEIENGSFRTDDFSHIESEMEG